MIWLKKSSVRVLLFFTNSSIFFFRRGLAGLQKLMSIKPLTFAWKGYVLNNIQCFFIFKITLTYTYNVVKIPFITKNKSNQQNYFLKMQYSVVYYISQSIIRLVFKLFLKFSIDIENILEQHIICMLKHSFWQFWH